MAVDVERRGRGGVVTDGSREGNGGGAGFLLFASKYEDEATEAERGGAGMSCGCDSLRGGGSNSFLGGGARVFVAVLVGVEDGTVVDVRRAGSVWLGFVPS
jgi:hypothetical protein